MGWQNNFMLNNMSTENIGLLMNNSHMIECLAIFYVQHLFILNLSDKSP